MNVFFYDTNTVNALLKGRITIAPLETAVMLAGIESTVDLARAPLRTSPGTILEILGISGESIQKARKAQRETANIQLHKFCADNDRWLEDTFNFFKAEYKALKLISEAELKQRKNEKMPHITDHHWLLLRLLESYGDWPALEEWIRIFLSFDDMQRLNSNADSLGYNTSFLLYFLTDKHDVIRNLSLYRFFDNYWQKQVDGQRDRAVAERMKQERNKFKIDNQSDLGDCEVVHHAAMGSFLNGTSIKTVCFTGDPVAVVTERIARYKAFLSQVFDAIRRFDGGKSVLPAYDLRANPGHVFCICESGQVAGVIDVSKVKDKPLWWASCHGSIPSHSPFLNKGTRSGREIES
jgi:hypothetical protein